MTDKKSDKAKTKSGQSIKETLPQKTVSRKNQKKKEKKRRLFSTLRYQVGLPPALALILPSLATRHASAQNGESLLSTEQLAETEHQAIHSESPKVSSSNLVSKQELIEPKANLAIEEGNKITPSARLQLNHYHVHAITNPHLLFGHDPKIIQVTTKEYLPSSIDHSNSSAESDLLAKNNNEPSAKGKSKSLLNVDNHENQQSSENEQGDLLGAPGPTQQYVANNLKFLNQQLQVKEDGLIVHGQLIAADKNTNETISFATNTQVDGLTLNPDGSYTFDPTDTVYQSLREGEIKELTVPVTVTDSVGLTSHANFVIQVTGTNDIPKVTGQVSGHIQEDINVDSSGLLTVVGQVRVHDIDHGESHTLAEVIKGQFGTLTIDEQGHWQYQVDNSLNAVQQLSSQQKITETISIHTADHTSQNIQIVIGGSDDNAVISGIDSGAVVEDLHVKNGSIKTQGDLTIVDTDIGEAHFASQVLVGQFGSLNIDANGHWSYEANNLQAAVQQLGKGDELHETFTVASVDGTTHEIKIEIDGVNDLPVMAGQSQSFKEDGAVFHGQMVGTDVDQDLLTYSISHPIDGLTFNSDGSYTFDPSHASYQHLAKGDTQVVTTTVNVIDTAGGSHREELKFTITGTNDLPVMAGQSQSVKEDGAMFHGQMVGTDVDQDLLTYSISHPIDGLTFNPDGSYTFDPSHASYQHLAKGDTQVVTTTVNVIDTAGGSHREELKFTITGTNDLPVMAGQSQSVKEDGAVFHGKMVGTDVDQDLLTYSISHPIDGLTFNPDGSYTFDPSHASYQHLAKGDTQVVTTTVNVIDTAGGSHREELKFTITGTNDLPVMAGQSQSVKEDGAVFHGQMVGTDVDQDLLTYSISHPIDGLTFNPDGSYSFDPSHASYQHIGSGDSEVVKTVVTVTDSAGGQSQQELSFTVHGTNDIPNVSTSVILPTGDEDKPYLIQASSLLSNVTDVDTNDLGKLTVANLEALKPDSTPAGTITDNHDGTFTFTPEANYNGSVLFYYKVKDAHGGVMLDHASTSLNAVADNAQISYAAIDQHQSGVTEDRGYIDTHDKLHFEGKLDIVDPDQGEAMFDINYGPQTYTGIGYDTKLGGHILLMRDGHYTYTIRDHQPQVQSLNQGEVLTDQCVVRAKDGTTFTIEVSIHGTNDAPVISQAVILAPGVEDTRMTITTAQLLANATDVDTNDSGQLSVANLSVDHGAVHINPDGTFSFTPEKDYNGKVHFNYDVTDAHGGTTHTGASTTLSATPDGAIISEVTTDHVTEDGSHSRHNAGVTTELANGRLQVVDPDSGENKFQYSQFGESAVHDPFGGMLRIDSMGNWGYSVNNANLQHLAEGQTETVVYRVHSYDGTAYELHIDVIGTNDAPTVTQVALSNGTEDTHYQMQASQFGFHDIDTGDTLHFIAITDLPPATQGKFVLDGHDITAGQPIPTADISKLQFIPAQDFNGDVQFKYTVSDGHTDSAEATNTLHIDAVGDKAVITGVDTGDVYENRNPDMSPNFAQPGMAHLTNSMIHVEGQLTIIDPDTGENSFDSKGIGYTYHGKYGHLILNTDGKWFYGVATGTADVNGGLTTNVGSTIDQLGANETLTDTITIQSKDGTTHDIVITIHGDNDRPYCSGEVQLNSGKEDLAQTITASELLANTVDVDTNDTGKLTITNLHADHGSILDNQDGTFTFTPSKDYNGQVHFTYDVQDAHGGVTATGATLQLAAVSDSAQIIAAGVTLKEDHVLSGTTSLHSEGQFHVIDPDGPSESQFAMSPGQVTSFYKGSFGGKLQIYSNGNYFYNIDNSTVDQLRDGEHVTDRFTIKSADGTTKEIEFVIQGTSDTPTIARSSLHEYSFEDGSVLHGRLDGLDPDKGDKQTLTYEALGSAAGFHLDPDGSYTFDPSNSAYQHASLTYGSDLQIYVPVKVTDSEGLSSVHNMRFTIMATNDAPIVTSSVSLSSGTEDHSVVLHSRELLAHASDIDDHDRLHVSNLHAEHGSITDNHDGTFTFTPDSNYNGTVKFSYDVTDNHGASTHTSASMTLAAVEDKTEFIGANHGIASEDVRTPMSNHVSLLDAVDWQALQITDVDSANTQVTVEFSGHQYTWDLGTDLDVTTPYGKFQFHTITSGPHQGEHSWNYIGDNKNSDVQGLKAGESIQETIKLIAKDGTEFPIHVEVKGTEDGVVIDSTSELGHVIENAQTGASVSGQLNAHDTDIHDQVHWTATPSSGVSGSYGTFHVDTAGQWHYDVDQGKATQLGTGDEKWEYFNVEAVSSDGSQVTKRVAVVVHGHNDNPTVTSDVSLATSKEDKVINLAQADLLAHASNVDTNDRGWLRVTNLTTDHGHITTNQDGSFTFTPDTNYNGIVHFNYDVTDRHGGSTPAQASVSLQAVNDLPSVHGDSSGTVREAGIDAHGAAVGSASVQGTLNATDPDSGDTVAWHVTQQSGTYGRLTVDQHGQWHYQLNDASAPVQQLVQGATAQDTFVVTATDKSGTPVSQTVTIDVQGSNDGASIDGHTTSSLSLDLTEDSTTSTLNGHLQLTDVDNGENQFVPLTKASGTYGHLDLDANGDWTYTLDNQLAATNGLHSGQVVTDRFVIQSPDGTASKSITVNIHGHDDLPTLTVNEGEAVNSLDLFAGIQGQGVSGLQYSTDGIHYSSTPPEGFVLDTDGHTLHVDVSGTGYEHLATGAKQSIYINYQLQEGTGANQHSVLQHGLVEVIGTSDAPVLHQFSPRANQFSGPVRGNLLSSATDVDDGAHLVLTDIQYKEGGRYHTLLPGQSHDIAGVGTIHIEANGDYVFTPDSTFIGNVPSMWYRVTDTTDSQNVEKQSTLDISIDANHQPTVAVLSASFNEDTDLAISTSDFGYADRDSDALHWITITQVPDASHGHLIVDGRVVINGNLIPANMLDRLIFRPVTDYNGSATFSYKAHDGHLYSAEQHAQLSITPVNDAPAIHLTPVTPVKGTVTQTDVDIGDTHQFGVVAPSGQFGTLSVDQSTGAYQYVPNGHITGMNYNQQTGHYLGHDTFEVSVTDKAGATSSMFVTFDVEGIVTAPAISGLAPTVSTQVTANPTVANTAPRAVLALHQGANRVSIDLSSTSDSGSSNSDNLTNIQVPEISGHTDIPFSEVKLYDGNKVIGSGYSDGRGDYQIVVTTLANGAHNLHALAIGPASAVPATSSMLPITIDTQAPTPTVTVDTITSDNVLNASESQSMITISGDASGGTHQGDIVTIEVGGHSYSGKLDAAGHYNIDVPGSELEQVSKVKVSITVLDDAGNSATTSIDHHYDVDISVGSPIISFESPGSDNLYSKAEIAQGAAGTITATVHAAADAKVGEHLNINGVDHVLDAYSLKHGINLEVTPSTPVRAVMTDEHGNVNSALNVAAGAKPEPIVVTAPSGSHQISTSLGTPTLMPTGQSAAHAQQGWRILVNGQYQTSFNSHWGTLTIDPHTGHLSYHDHGTIHTGPHGSATDLGVHEEHFEIALQGSLQDDITLHVKVSILNHGPGHSGKLTEGSEVLDMTVTPLLNHNPPPPPPPPSIQTSADEPMTSQDDASFDSVTIMSELGITKHMVDDSLHHMRSPSVNSYMDKLGIHDAQEHSDTSEQHALPDDIDVVLNDAEHISEPLKPHLDEHNAEPHQNDESDSIHHGEDIEHHHNDDPTLPDDLSN